MKINLHSISARLIIGGVLIVLIPIFVVGFYSVSKSRKALDHMAENQAVQVSQDLANMTDLVLSQELKLAQAMGGLRPWP